MSWGYWGIVGGLAAMVALFFVCLGILGEGRAPGGPRAAGGSGKGTHDAEPGTRHAA